MKKSLHCTGYGRGWTTIETACRCMFRLTRITTATDKLPPDTHKGIRINRPLCISILSIWFEIVLVANSNKWREKWLRSANDELRLQSRNLPEVLIKIMKTTNFYGSQSKTLGFNSLTVSWTKLLFEIMWLGSCVWQSPTYCPDRKIAWRAHTVRTSYPSSFIFQFWLSPTSALVVWHGTGPTNMNFCYSKNRWRGEAFLLLPTRYGAAYSIP
jgi:hypothetical protein